MGNEETEGMVERTRNQGTRSRVVCGRLKVSSETATIIERILMDGI